MSRKPDISEAAYRRMYPDRYAVLVEARRSFEEIFPDFPEGFCTSVSALIVKCLPNCYPMCGAFNGSRHMWVYDVQAKAHIDLTLDQFIRPPREQKIWVFPSKSSMNSMQQLGYSIGNLSLFDELFASELKNILRPERHLITHGPKIYMADVLRRSIVLHTLWYGTACKDPLPSHQKQTSRMGASDEKKRVSRAEAKKSADSGR